VKFGGTLHTKYALQMFTHVTYSVKKQSQQRKKFDFKKADEIVINKHYLS